MKIFNTGDVVQLKSGGPKMTVVGPSNPAYGNGFVINVNNNANQNVELSEVHVIFFMNYGNGGMQLQRQNLPEDCLKSAEEDED